MNDFRDYPATIKRLLKNDYRLSIDFPCRIQILTGIFLFLGPDRETLEGSSVLPNVKRDRISPDLMPLVHVWTCPDAETLPILRRADAGNGQSVII